MTQVKKTAATSAASRHGTFAGQILGKPACQVCFKDTSEKLALVENMFI